VIVEYVKSVSHQDGFYMFYYALKNVKKYKKNSHHNFIKSSVKSPKRFCV